MGINSDNFVDKYAANILDESTNLVKEYKSARFKGWIFILVGFIISILVFRSNPNLLIFIALGFFALVGVCFAYISNAKNPLLALRGRVRKQVVEGVLSERADNVIFNQNGRREIDFRYDIGSVLPTYDRYSSEDFISGKIEEKEFGFYEVKLEEKHEEKDKDGKTKIRWENVFRGYIIFFDFETRYDGYIRLAPNSRFGQLFDGLRSDERIKLESTEFEKQFDVYADDQIAARTVVTPKFMQKFSELATSTIFNKDVNAIFKTLRGKSSPFHGFIDNKRMNIAVYSFDDKFELPPLTEPIDVKEFAGKIKEDFNILFEFINATK